MRLYKEVKYVGFNLGLIIQSKDLILGVIRIQRVIKATGVSKISEGKYVK